MDGLLTAAPAVQTMPTSSGNLATASRTFWAFAAFNVYSLFLISAFQANSLYLFDAKLVSEMDAAGAIFDVNDWGWKDHYIWRLFAAVVVTAIAAFLAGAIAQEKGRKIALVANLPSILVWAITFYLMAFTPAESTEGQTGFMIVSLIAIPLTSWIAYYAGNIGCEVQASDFAKNTVLGIRPSHWIWIAFPLYVYFLGIVFVAVKFLGLEFFTWRDVSVVGAIISSLALIPVIAWMMPLIITYNVLTGKYLRAKRHFVKALTNAAILVGGLFVALGIQYVSYLVLQPLMSWWY
jgi:hypothetical protein